MDWKALFLSFGGRISQRDFWIGFAIVMVASMLVNLIPGIGPLLGLALLWPQMAIHTKRLHDFGRSAWLLLVPAAVSVAAGAIMFVRLGEAAMTAPLSA